MRRMSLAAVLATATCLAVLVVAAPSQAAFPTAQNGRIVYIHSDRTGLSVDDIFLIDSNGSNPVNVTHTTHQVEYQEPRFSPDGSLITTNRCSNVAPSTTCDIAVIRPDGSGLVDVTPTPTVLEEDEPSFAPNGK
jgi:Tol biopolymer transport system component